MAARARLRGEVSPRSTRRTPAAMADVTPAAQPPAVFDAEALAFLAGFWNPRNRFMREWLPAYRLSIAAIATALSAGREEDLFDSFWKRAANDIANSGRGVLSHAEVDAIRPELIKVVGDIHADGSAESFERIVARFESWSEQKNIAFVPRLLIARAFASIHPARYHTTVDAHSQSSTLAWFATHTGFEIPATTSWAFIAEALTAHLGRSGVFRDDILSRNVFPWFVVEQLRARAAPASIPPGHSPRAYTTQFHVPEVSRTVSLRHNALQSALFHQLESQYAPKKIWTEYPTGTGGFADAVAQTTEGDWHLFEIKVAESAADVVRQAMGQLLEYGFRHGGLSPTTLFAVGEPELDDLTRQFLTRLTAQFNLHIDYLQVNLPPDWMGTACDQAPLNNAPVSPSDAIQLGLPL